MAQGFISINGARFQTGASGEVLKQYDDVVQNEVSGDRAQNFVSFVATQQFAAVGTSGATPTFSPSKLVFVNTGADLKISEFTIFNSSGASSITSRVLNLVAQTGNTVLASRDFAASNLTNGHSVTVAITPPKTIKAGDAVCLYTSAALTFSGMVGLTLFRA